MEAALLLTGFVRGEGIEALSALLGAERFVAELDRLGPTGTNACHIATWRNNLALVEALLAAGASADVADKESGWTPLHRALHFGHLRIAAALLAGNASLAVPDWRGRTPLDLASSALRRHMPPPGAPGDVFSWGAGTNYALGTGSTEPLVAPARIDALHGKRVVALAAAKFHSVAITEDGELYTWGFGHGGRLGHPGAHAHGGEGAVIVPRLVSSLGRRRVVAVAAAKHHTLMCTTAGEVWAMGSNRHGQLGLSSADTQPEPRRVGALRARVVAVAAANKHSAAVTAAGEVYTWGSNALGQLGYGTFDSASSAAPRLVEALKGRVVVAAAAAKRHTLALTADGDVYTWGHRGVSPRRVPLTGARDAAASDGRPLRFHRGHADVVRPEAVAVAAGAAHSSALTATGVVLTWRSADPALVVQEVGGALAGRRLVAVSAGKYRTAVVTAEGDVYCWEGRSDFFPAEGRTSGSGSKKAKGGAVAGAAPGARPIPMLGSSPGTGVLAASLSRHLSGGSAGAEFAPMESPFGSSLGASSRPGGKPGGGGGGSFFERVYSQHRESSGGVSLTARPETPRSAARAATAAADGFETIEPQRVPGLKRAGAVAVGEKHSLALQRWGVSQIEGLPELPWLQAGVAVVPGAAARASGDWETELGLDGDDESESETASAPQSAQTSPFRPNGGTLAAAASAAFGPRPLQQLCEEAVGLSLVDPRTALQVLEYADLAGASVLRAYCLAVAVCNLDAILTEALGAFEDLPPHLMADLEVAYKSQLRGGGGNGGTGPKAAPTAARRTLDLARLSVETGGEGGEATPAQAVHQGPRRRLQPGPRPTAARLALGDLESEGLAAAVGAAGSGAFSPPSLRGEASFKDLGTAEAEAAEQRLRRTLGKKVQQIEALEERAAAGAVLDPQQRAKVAQRPVVAAALAALDAGTAPEEVQAMLAAAAAAAAEHATASLTGTSPPKPAATPASANKTGKEKEVGVADGAAAEGKGSGGKPAKTRSRRRTSERSVLGAEASAATVDGSIPSSSGLMASPFAGAASPPVSAQVPALPGSAVPVPRPQQPAAAPTHVVGFTTSPNAAAAKQAARAAGRSAEKPPPRKGGLSMFLRGDLDRPTEAKEEGKSKGGPAWGGKPAATAAPASLKELLGSQTAAGAAMPPPSGRTPQPGATAKSKTPAESADALRMPLSAFLNPTSPAAAGGGKPAWGSGTGGGGGGVPSGASPPNSGRQPSLREIQEDQARRKAAAVALPWSASPPATARPPLPGRTAPAAAIGAPLLGTSPGASSTLVLGTSPSGRAFFAAPAPQSRWYVPEDEELEQRRIKSLAAIQTEESAMKEIAALYGDATVRIAKDDGPQAGGEAAASSGKPRRRRSKPKPKGAPKERAPAARMDK